MSDPVIEIAFRLAKIHLAIVDGLQAAGEEYGDDVVRIIVQLISLPYPPASLPGEPPHRRTSALRASYKSTVSRFGNRVEVETSSSKEYSVYLEYGTRFMAPRPHFRPGVEIAKTGLTTLVASHVEQSVLAAVLRMGGR